MKKIPVICYKQKVPTVYNRGTKWEETCDEFLACYGCDTIEDTEAFINELNTNEEKKNAFCERYCLKVENIAYFFCHEQEPFDTRGD